MDRFTKALSEIRERSPQLFDEWALRQPPQEDLVVPVSSIDIPTRTELEAGETRDVNRTAEHQRILADIPPAEYEEPWTIEPDREDFDISERAAEERGGFATGRTQLATELLAVYLPFHFYPEGAWGVRFFERPVLQFAKMIVRGATKQGLSYSLDYLVKVVVYAVARHEFEHYLTELFALQLELMQGRRFYRPYYDQVYKKTYPTSDCIEETVANYWLFDNAVIRTPIRLQKLFRYLVAKSPGAYGAADLHNAASIRPVEDRLVSQVNQVVATPSIIPTLWGQLPRPYVQPWTRYENLEWTMNRSAGAILGPILNARPLRRTMRIYHR